MSQKDRTLSGSPHWPYLAAASVLTDFEPQSLRPLEGGKPDIGRIGAMLNDYGEVISSGPARGRWRLGETVRRATLAELKRNGQLDQALQANQQPENPTQRALSDLVQGRRRKLRDSSFGELLGLERALDWLNPQSTESGTDRPEVLASLERLRLLEPLQRLLANGFAGRKDELRVLRSYVDELPSKSISERITRGFGNLLDVFRARPPLVILGPGGVGKSTLVAKFINDHAGADQEHPVPFIVLDFDRGALDPQEPDSIVADSFRQIREQFPALAKRAAALEKAADRRLAGETEIRQVSRSAHFGESERLRDALSDLLKEISEAHNKNLLFFVDTFEVVQRRGATPVYNILNLAAHLMRKVTRLRVVFAGRAGIRDLDFRMFSDAPPPRRELYLKGFDKEASRAYLRARTERSSTERVSEEVLDRIADAAEGNPLSLRLAAEVFKEEGSKGLEDAVGLARFDAAFTQERYQGVLHARIVNHLPKHLQKIADPGLVVRRITPEVIKEVLAVPCKLTSAEIKGVDGIFDDLENEISLMEWAGDRVLKHRSDVRLLMLPLMRKRLGEQAREIDRAAVDFWSRRDTPEERAEELYHLLWLDAEEKELDACWSRGSVLLGSVEEALDEFEAIDADPKKRLWLIKKLGRELPADLEKEADLAEWEQHATLRAGALLRDGEPQKALNFMRSRAKRTPASPLWIYEIEALKLLGKDDEAFSCVEKALDSSRFAYAPDNVHYLVMLKASLFERSGAPDNSLACIDQADLLAEALNNEFLKLTNGVARARLLRKLGREHESRELRQRLASMLGQASLYDALTDDPSQLREAAAEIGTLRPELFLELAERIGRDFSSDPHAQSALLVSLGVALAEVRRLDEAISLLERAVGIAKESEDPAVTANALAALGNAYSRVGELDKSMAAHEESVRLSRAYEDIQEQGWKLNNLGNVLAARGQLSKAEAAYNEALAIERDAGDRDGEASVLGNLGILYQSMGHPERALALLEHKLSMTRELGNRRDEGLALANLGAISSQLGRTEQAVELYELSLSIAKEIGDVATEGDVLGNLGSVYLSIDEPARAIEFLNASLEVYRKTDNRIGLGKVLGNLGIANQRLRNLHKAVEYYREQLAVSPSEGDPYGAGLAQFNMALALNDMGDREAALAAMRSAKDLLEPIAHPAASLAADWLSGTDEKVTEQLNLKLEASDSSARDLAQLSHAIQSNVDVLLKQTL